MLLQDLREVLPEVRKNFHKFTGRCQLVTLTNFVFVVDAGKLENIYDDTQQLQCDLGM